MFLFFSSIEITKFDARAGPFSSKIQKCWFENALREQTHVSLQSRILQRNLRVYTTEVLVKAFRRSENLSRHCSFRNFEYLHSNIMMGGGNDRVLYNLQLATTTSISRWNESHPSIQMVSTPVACESLQSLRQRQTKWQLPSLNQDLE